MTIAPLPLPVPAGPGSVPVPMGPDAEASAETFAALVTQLLAGQGQPATGLPAATAVPVAGAPAPESAEDVITPGAAAAEETEQAAAGDAPGDASTDQAAALLPQATAFLAALPLTAAIVQSTNPVVASVTAEAIAVTAATATSAATSAATTEATPTVDAGPAAVPAPSTTGQPTTADPAAPRPAGPASTAAPAAAAPAAPAAAPAETAQTPATEMATGQVASPPQPSAGTRATAATGRQQETPSDATLPIASSQPAAATAGVAPPSVAGAVAGPTGPAMASVPNSPSTAVTQQVFPEITRLVSAGNGTHRVRLQLEPEALGDVRVVLTIRNGAVHVRLAAGEDAQRALREGAPELRRLLELAGASDTRIVVRDLSSGSAPGTGTGTALTGQWSDGLGRGTSGDVWSGGDRSQHQHAGTRGGSNAREGTNDGAVPHRPVQPATRTRTGVDVTM